MDRRSSPFLKKLFLSLNDRYFSSYLPSTTVVKWGHKGAMVQKRGGKRFALWGYSLKTKRGMKIVISEEIRSREKLIVKGEFPPTLQALLLHEMAHLADQSSALHGQEFREIVKHLVKRGGFGKMN